jgi:hypothetical protein
VILLVFIAMGTPIDTRKGLWTCGILAEVGGFVFRFLVFL